MEAKQKTGLIIGVLGLMTMLTPWWAGILLVILGGLMLSMHRYGDWIYKKLIDCGIVIEKTEVTREELYDR